jgi:hypothetical protein
MDLLQLLQQQPAIMYALTGNDFVNGHPQGMPLRVTKIQWFLRHYFKTDSPLSL